MDYRASVQAKLIPYSDILDADHPNSLEFILITAFVDEVTIEASSDKLDLRGGSTGSVALPDESDVTSEIIICNLLDAPLPNCT